MSKDPASCHNSPIPHWPQCREGRALLAVRGGTPPHQAAGEAEGRRRQDGDLRDGLRAVGAAAHRHVRRGGAHQHGAPRLRAADRGALQDAPHLLLRRHGRPAQGAVQRSQSGDAARGTRQAADRRCPTHSASIESFAHHNNAMLRDFLDRFGFSYEFMSATEAYKAGRFDETLLQMLKVYDKVMDIILPTLGPERRATYSPFLPVSPTSGRCCRCRWSSAHPRRAPIVYVDPDTGKKVETSVTGGAVKCQWKADWALRWTALGVDYEMAGKDLIDSVTLSSRICKALGGTPPEGFNYELFLDDKGEKISKSKGNGLTIDEWLTLCLARKPVAVHVPEAEGGQAAVLRRDPARGRRVSAVPRRLSAPGRQGQARQRGLAHPCGRSAGRRPADHVRAAAQPRGRVERRTTRTCCGASSAATRRASSPQTHPLLDQLAGYAVRYYEDFVKPQKKFRLRRRGRGRRRCARCRMRSARCGAERNGRGPAGRPLRRRPHHPALSGPERQGRDAGQARRLQRLVRRHLSGAAGRGAAGPRFGSFIELYGVENTS